MTRSRPALALVLLGGFRSVCDRAVANGKISHVISVFDRLPAVQAQGGQPG